MQISPSDTLQILSLSCGLVLEIYDCVLICIVDKLHHEYCEYIVRPQSEPCNPSPPLQTTGH
jgi:hypothetical protein